MEGRKKGLLVTERDEKEKERCSRDSPLYERTGLRLLLAPHA